MNSRLTKDRNIIERTRVYYISKIGKDDSKEWEEFLENNSILADRRREIMEKLYASKKGKGYYFYEFVLPDGIAFENIVLKNNENKCRINKELVANEWLDIIPDFRGYRYREMKWAETDEDDSYEDPYYKKGENVITNSLEDSGFRGSKIDQKFSTPTSKYKPFQIQLTKEEYNMLQELKNRFKKPASKIVRSLIHTLYKTIGRQGRG